MSTYNVTIEGNDTLRVGFGDAASNDVIVKDAVAGLAALGLRGGPLLKINGAASLPVAVALAHGTSHLYGAVAVWDPKLGRYVVSVSHNPEYSVGDLID
jgi:CRISPR-associated protein Csx3